MHSSERRRRAAKKRLLDLQERAAKEQVRARDRTCRFPLCRCRQKLYRQTEVSHRFHKGMGGNPTGDRSRPELMILVCAARHRTTPWSIDQKTVRWVPLTEAGSNGPVAWELKLEGTWVEVARETPRGLDVNVWHRALLIRLADSC